MSRIATIVCAAALVAGCAMGGAPSQGGGAAAAKGPDAAATIQARVAAMRGQGGAMRSIGEQARSATPDAAALKAAAAKLKTSADQLPSWFPKGTGPESGQTTRAKPEIWTDAAGFAAASKALRDEAAKLDGLAAGSDMAAVQAQLGAVNRACSGCHAKYRAPETPAPAPAA